MGWDGSTNPPSPLVDLKALISNFTLSTLRFTRLHCTLLTGGAIGGASELVYPVLMILGFQFLGNWIGFPSGAATCGTADLVKQGIINLVMGRRQKITYHPSKRDSSIIFDLKLVESDDHPDANPPTFRLTLDSDLGNPPIQ